MRRPALLPAALAVTALALTATPAAAQYYDTGSRDYGRDSGRDYGHNYDRDDRRGYDQDYARDYRYAPTRRSSTSATAGWRSQLDRPGDYRCDAFWDAGRTDCAAPWRDQRRSRGYGYVWNNAGYGQTGRYSGYGQSDPYYGSAPYGGSRYGYSSSRRGYGHAPLNTGRAEAWHGAYGRPDLVYSNTGYRDGRDPHRVAWCRSSYRSYDPASGYYRAYSGRLVYCG
ncbi:BA14K family protein [Brevundimonas sp.]|uniref:BA14K family protein n=1 Tax=Brevundimonas sp. TaxID=1871086 RepID=UPI003A92A7D8